MGGELFEEFCLQHFPDSHSTLKRKAVERRECIIMTVSWSAAGVLRVKCTLMIIGWGIGVIQLLTSDNGNRKWKLQ